MSRALTARTVETIKPGPDRKEIPDRHLPGLYLIVQPSGARQLGGTLPQDGQSRKHTLGSYPALDLKAARELAGKALRAVAEGRDPGREKISARTERPDTVEVVAQLFVERHCLRVNRPRTIESTQRLLDLHVLPRWRRRLIKDITRRDVLDLLDSLVESGRPVAANRVLTAVRKMFNWAMERDIIATSPCAGVKPPTPEQSRDRMLARFRAAQHLACRQQARRPVCGARQVADVDRSAARRGGADDLGRSRPRMPGCGRCRRSAARTAKPHDIPLSDPAVAILESLPRIGETFVLTTTGTSPASSYSKGKRRLDALLPADMPAWWLHDLRRSMASGMARLGVYLPVIEKVLNHTSGRSAASSASISATTLLMKSATRLSVGARMSPIWFPVVAVGMSSGSRRGHDFHVDAVSQRR